MPDRQRLAEKLMADVEWVGCKCDHCALLREAAEWLRRDEVRLVALEEAIHAAMLTNGGETDGDDDWNYVMVRRDAFDRLDARDKEREGRARP